jgi:hypothetical protein
MSGRHDADVFRRRREREGWDEDLTLVMLTLMRLEGKVDMILALLGANGGEEEADL